MTLYGDFLSGNHRRIHKWYQYFPAYERHFERFRNRHVTLFEIGIGEGGSLQQWRRYLGPFARIVGIDFNPNSRQVEEDQIHVRIGGQANARLMTEIIAEFGEPDIVIDDGGHYQPYVHRTFNILYPRVAKNGLYVIEDLHAAYFPSHGGGLHYDGSFIERAKAIIDEMHAEYTGGEQPRTAIGDRTTSIHFYDSIVVLEVGEYRIKGHRLTGDPTLWRADWQPSEKSPHDIDPVEPLRIHFSRGPNDREKPPGTQMPDPHSAAPSTPPAAAPQLHALEMQIAALRSALAEADASRDRVRDLEAEIAMLRASTSWRLTGPIRAVKKLIRHG